MPAVNEPPVMMKGPREIVRHSKPDHPIIVWHWNARKFHPLTLSRGKGRRIEKFYDLIVNVIDHAVSILWSDSVSDMC
jgi:hypothetical protein